MYEAGQKRSVRTWNTPHEMPHIASPNASTDKDGAKNEIKTDAAIQTMKNIIVLRHPNLSLQYEFTTRPNSSPTKAELAKPDCHGAEISFFLVPGS